MPGRLPEAHLAAPAGPNKWLVLATVGLGTFLAVLDGSVVNVSLPTITRELHTDLTTIQWVVMAYLLAITGLLLPCGRLADLVGRKRIYVLGLAVFAVGTLLGGIAQDVRQLIAFRAVQGVGSAMISAIGAALIAGAFPAGERGKALGISGMIVAAGGISGPVVGGLLADLVSWRWIFFFRVPFGLVAVLLALRFLPDTPPTHQRRFDVAGGALVFIWLATVMLGLNRGQSLGWGSPAILALFAMGFLCFAAFIVVEWRSDEPMLELGLFRNRLFPAASASVLFIFVATFAVNFLMPFYLIEALGLSQRAAGLMLISGPLAMSVAAPLSGWLSDRIGSRILSAAGMGICCVALLSISWLDETSSLADVGIRLAAIGLGSGLFQSPNSSSLLSAVPPSMMGIASGMIATMRNLGMGMGTAIAGAVWTGRMAFYADQLAIAGAIDQSTVALQSFVGGFQDAFLVAAAICSIGVFTSLVRGSTRPAPRGVVASVGAEASSRGDAASG